MICKIYKNDSIGATLEYNFKNASELIGTQNLIGEDRKEIEYQMRDTQQLYTGRGRKTAAHVILSPAISDGKKMPLELWKTLAEEFLTQANMMGHESAYFLHRDKEHFHLHIVVNKIDPTGKMYHAQDEWRLAHSIAENLAKKHGLLSASDIQKENELLRKNKVVPGIKGHVSLKQDCIDAVLESLYHNEQFETERFFELLEKKGYSIKKFYKNETGLLHGFGVSYLNENQQEVFYKASEIGRDFTLANIGKTALRIFKQQEKAAAATYWQEHKERMSGKTKGPIKHYDFKTKKVSLVPRSIRDQFMKDCPVTEYETSHQWASFVQSKGYTINIDHISKRYSITREGYTLHSNEIGKQYSIAQLERSKKQTLFKQKQSSAKVDRELSSLIDKMDTSEPEINL